MDRDPALPVVVAIDDSGSADDAVEWAAAEAAARHRPLRVVHVLTVPLSVDPCATGAVIAQVASERGRARTVLDRSVARAAAVASDLEVSTGLLDGPTVWALQREGRNAAELVLGLQQRRTGLRAVFTDSVSGRVASGADCPVIVVRRRHGRVRSWPTVVVGFDSSLSCRSALRFAVCAAWQREIPLTVVHSADVEPALAHWRRQLPGLEVRTQLVVHDPATELTEAAAGAALLVLGSAGRRRFLRPAVSVGRQLLDEAGCPIAIVRNYTETTPTASWYGSAPPRSSRTPST